MLLNNLSTTAFPLFSVLKITQETPQKENLLKICLKISLKADNKMVATGVEIRKANETYKSSLSSKMILEKEESLISEIKMLKIIIKNPTNVHPQNFFISSVEGIIMPGYKPTKQNNNKIIGITNE